MSKSVVSKSVVSKAGMDKPVIDGARPVQITLARLVASVARVGLGLMWIYQGWFKLQAHFGGADILLVVQSTAGNSRVPGFFKFFTHSVLGTFPDLFGVLIPLMELSLGVALLLGILTLPVAMGSVFTLMTYWLSDQLIWEYPIMVLLSAAVLVWSAQAGTFSVSALLIKLRPVPWANGALRRWL